MPFKHVEPAPMADAILLWQSFVFPDYASLEPALDEMQECVMRDHGWTERDALGLWLHESNHGEEHDGEAMVTLRQQISDNEIFGTFEPFGADDVQLMRIALANESRDISKADFDVFAEAFGRAYAREVARLSIG